MKKLFTLISVVVLSFVSCSKYDEAALWNKSIDMDGRLTELERLCNRMNTNISSLQALVTAVQGYDYVTDVTPIMQDGKEIGYTISFTKSSPITIYHGKEGEKGETGATGNDGHTPVIGVRQDDDGIYYWTVDGDWLTDKKTGDKIQAQGTNGSNGKSAYELAVENGYTGTLDEWLEALKGSNGLSAYELAVEKGYQGTQEEWLESLQGEAGQPGTPGQDGNPGADGITPKLKIDNGYWYVSYDKEHQRWEQLGKATGEDGADGAPGQDGDPMFQRVTQDEYNVYFTLIDQTTITIPKKPTLAINFTEGASFVFQVDETKTVHYTITGGNANNVIKAEMLNNDGAYSLHTVSSSATAGTIEIKAKVPTVNRVIVSVSDGSHTIMAAIDVSIAPSFDGKIVTVAKPGTLSKLLAGYDQTTITELTVIGSLNDYDIETLKALPNLAVLDMEDVNMANMPVKAFYNKKSLTSITLPKTLITIGNYAFYGCSGLTGNLAIPESVTTIGEITFHGCSGFTGNLTIPESVTTIGYEAFEGCSGFTGSLTISESVTTIGSRAFYGCSGFTGNLTIPESVTTIGYEAFEGCSGFTGNLTIPESVTTIKESAFEGCSGFTGNLTIPESVTTIMESAFYGCSGFTGNLTIPESVTTIGSIAFCGCSGFTGNLTIPKSVTTIGNGAFVGCSSLINVYCKATTPPQINNSIFSLLSKLILYVPTGCADAYRTAPEWSEMNFKEIIETNF